jgi:sialic acid synthase SpsE
VISRDMLTVKRPGTGLPPGELAALVGRKARVKIEAGSLITTEMV